MPRQYIRPIASSVLRSFSSFDSMPHSLDHAGWARAAEPMVILDQLRAWDDPLVMFKPWGYPSVRASAKQLMPSRCATQAKNHPKRCNPARSGRTNKMKNTRGKSSDSARLTLRAVPAWPADDNARGYAAFARSKSCRKPLARNRCSQAGINEQGTCFLFTRAFKQRGVSGKHAPCSFPNNNAMPGVRQKSSGTRVYRQSSGSWALG